MQPEIIDLYLSDAATRKQWQGLLTDLGITNFAASETAHLDHTIGIYEGDKLVATGSTAGNVIKYVGACHKNSEAGAYFNAIISALLNDLAQRQIFHVFVFTKPKYVASFEYVGFHALAQTDSGAILETGDTGVQDYVAALPKIEHQDQAKVAGIVMNANPFTLGHRYLIETAAKENDLVYVFVVNTDASLFTTAERQQLVTAGTADLPNVRVVNGSDYMVSYATFPAYFLPTPEAAIRFQTQLDAQLFKTQIAQPLNLTTRYLGSEPFSKTTGIYNHVLQEILPPAVAVKIVDRKAVDDQPITATAVRQAIADNVVDTVAASLPATTLQFIQAHLTMLQARIQAGQRIAGN
ncbi:[citrate (pro-3S)-lyase] ligase [Levilactobacillus zymae]|uniref:[Citrate [pro-3S]-lyase] ligase n=1 Tax=Levilactobacillus zymae TaxID=267363 RepID=A0A1Y6JZW8_9LACO|nr:[citrate (pro-3S)-lyase] ligase [Levilactobacillus zymae]SMS15457.1 [Citrate [pro-3S]-lyase] ligase [Levilactobacillus zymae]